MTVGSIDLFGNPVLLKTYGCNHKEMPGSRIPASVNLFVKVTNGCNAHCLFCSNSGANPTMSFKEDKLFEIIDEILDKDIILNRVNITGGEPSIVMGKVESILSRLDSKRYSDIHVHLNTNGLLPMSQALMKHPRWDSISVSLHHYSLEKLSELYGTRIPDTALEFSGVDMMKVNASCNLIKGYIDSTEEAVKMMDFCLSKNFTRLGFVGLMPVNSYCLDHMISLDELHLDKVPHCYFTEAKDRGADCRCSNYLYNKNLKVLEIYMRHYMNPEYCESSLLYDGEFLRQGFHEKNIIY